jgi:hypothetical protein
VSGSGEVSMEARKRRRADNHGDRIGIDGAHRAAAM